MPEISEQSRSCLPRILHWPTTETRGQAHGSAGVGMFPTSGSEKSLWLPGRASNKPPAPAGPTVSTPDRLAIL